MTNTDELSRLARAITEAEDELNTSNHRDDCQQLAQIDEQRTALVERIEAREKALEDARADLLVYVNKPASNTQPAFTSGYVDSNPSYYTNGQGQED